MDPQRIVVVPKPLELTPLPWATLDDPESRIIAQRVALARSEHAHTVSLVRAALAERDDVAWVETPDAAVFAGARLIISIGGDGTFLIAARHAHQTPLLGVNSSPSTSTGHFCAALPTTFPAVLERCLTGHLALTPLARIRAEIDDEVLPYDALNDVLFANRVPVLATRYAVRIGDVTELHLSSGMWIATASGSTAAIRSAGGEVRPIDDTRMQWRVREPYVRDADPRPTLLSGFTRDPIELVSRSDDNALYLDGHREPHPVPRGARARLCPSPEPLFAYLPSPAD